MVLSMATKRLFKSIEQIQITNLTKTYGVVTAVDHVTLEVKGGELLILIGGSGSGKTTTLKMINRLIEPDQGTIHINGKNTTTFDPVTLRRNIGYVIQQIGLFPHLSVHDNIGLIPRLEQWPKQKITTKVRKLLQLVDLPPETFLHRYPKELSGGQQQRVGLARAMAMDPRLLLMDEPFGALDPILRKQLQEEFVTIKKDINRTIIFVTHDIDEAFKLGDRIAIMDKGKLVQVGTPKELLLNPENDLVRDLVNADKKFKHIETLTTADVMTPLTSKHILSEKTTVQQARTQVPSIPGELGIIADSQGVIGWARLKEICKQDNDDLVKDVVTQPLTFSTKEPMDVVLLTMKQQRQSMALILRGKQPVGVLLADEVLLQLV